MNWKRWRKWGLPLFFSLLSLPYAQAAEWTAGGSVQGRLESVTNPGLTEPPEETASRASLTLEAGLDARTELWDAALSAILTRSRSDAASLDTTDASLNLRAARRFELSTATLGATWQRGSTQAEELRTTGILLTRSQSESWNLSPSWQRSLSERLSFSAGASFSGTRYDQSQAATLTNSTSESVNAGISYALGPRTSAGLSASFTETDTDPFTTRAEIAAVQLSLTHSFSERLSGSASFGPGRSRQESAANVPICPAPQFFCDAGLIPFTVFSTRVAQVSDSRPYSFSARYLASDYTVLSLAGSRSDSASGAGFVTETEAVSGVLGHRLTEYLTLAADVGYTRARSLGDLVPGTLTETQRVGLTLTWQLAERWSLEAGANTTRVQLPAGFAPHTETYYAALRYTPERTLVR